ncbi:phytanoyl-CoA dioxygenase family protein [Streptomyces coeruleorubidus]|uniref:phytanoyl-CoA dioxygenase family protein n=1 Tax=Streptomyces coeruleorubidus TaxID=116188 RepID=UPI00237EF5F2|nr:phytanoyl-CoA dioxygenase family protein [Streptomyces coeruleorubidus]WDV50198.1 phytanoyl-CoA dioxygenase family protein [Streptomyces coeruleorubidus]
MAARVTTEGWAIAKNRLDADEIHNARTLIAAHFQAGKGVLLNGARVQPAAAHFVPGLAWLYAHPQVVEVARAALGTRDITFTGHSDAHQGFTLGWHKDSGSDALGDPLCGYFGESPDALFQGPPDVVKVGIYLQESTSLNCLRVDPGSHLRPHLQPVRPTEVLMEAGDLVVFDVRITHAGAMAPYPDSPELDALRERISAFVTFGRGGERTRKFSQANMRRQRRQLGLSEEEAVMAVDGGHAALLASQDVIVWEEG